MENPITGNAVPMTSSPMSEPTATEVTFNPHTHSNPYFLHINKNPALELVSFSLVGSNYHPWARAMSMSLSCKNKLAFVNGTITKPSTDDMEKYLAWERCNNMVVSWIVRTLSPTIGSSVLWIDTAYGVWEDLKRSRAVWIYLMKAKSEVKSLITQFCNLVENQFGTTVKCIRSDNGLEFNIQDYFSQNGIVHQTYCTYTPQQNSRVERNHGHLLSTARSLRSKQIYLNSFGESVSYMLLT
nr:uncharacterized protein LOC109174480 [Ipomoea batatas]